MVYELSKGSLYPLQGGADEKSSNSTDSCQNVDGCTSDVRKQDQHSACSNESENNDHSDSEHMDISSSSSRSETSSPTNDVQNQTESQFLIPDYKNQPDPDDICGLQWGKDHYIRHFPSLSRCLYTDNQCPFSREFIRRELKAMEPMIRNI
ncbi:hypothetical protein EMCRGX_G018364 [Ephydatia muelleri]